MANSAIQISWLLKKPTDLDLHCLENRVYPGSAGQGLSNIELFTRIPFLGGPIHTFLLPHQFFKQLF